MNDNLNKQRQTATEIRRQASGSAMRTYSRSLDGFEIKPELPSDFRGLLQRLDQAEKDRAN